MLSLRSFRGLISTWVVLIFYHSLQNHHTVDGFRPMDPTEMNALKDLFYATNGPYWNYPNVSYANFTSHAISARVPWNFSNPDANPCLAGWAGIRCAEPTGFSEYHVSHLNLDHFNMSGQLPTSLGNFTMIDDISMVSNALSGAIPAEIGNLNSIRVLHFDFNELTGILPTTIGNLHHLLSFGCSNNAMTGPIPDSFGQLQQLHRLDIQKNMLSQSIPAALGSMTMLELLYLYDNKFTGSLPEELGRMELLQGMYLSNNYFTGTLPDFLQAVSLLEYLFVHHNLLTGTIPASFSGLTSLQALQLNDNYLQGTIPSTLSSLSMLIQLQLQNNHLVGSIPTSLSNMSSLQVLQLQSNNLEGSLLGVIDPTRQPFLYSIQVSDNLLTGPIPDSLSNFKYLDSFTAVSNCMQTVLPPSLCDVISLYSLVIDGLGSARGCNSKLLPGVSNAYQSSGMAKGGLPACLFQLPNLTTLHLSGNGFTGPLPANVELGAHLAFLSLSHNRLTGSIPLNIQRRRWYQLDLSYNMLSGTLNADFATEKVNGTLYDDNHANVSTEIPSGLPVSDEAPPQLVYLENNRLSGRLPGYLSRLPNVSVLGSNLFQCNFWRTNLPKHDSGRSHYHCGSDSFNNPFYVWMILVVLGTFILLLLFCVKFDSSQHVQFVTNAVKNAMWNSMPRNLAALTLNVTVVFQVYDFLCRLAVVAVGFMVLVLLPCYVCFSVYNGTMTHQYAWVASAAYTSGTVPFGVEFVLLICLLALVISAFAHQYGVRIEHVVPPTSSQKVPKNPSNYSTEDTPRENTERLHVGRIVDMDVLEAQLSGAKLTAIYAIFLVVNLTVVVGVNLAFVLIAIYRSNSDLVVAQILISIFKIWWNSVCARWIIRYTAKVITRTSDSAAAQHVDFVSLQLFVSLFNNIVIPCLVVLMVSPNCFYNVLKAAPRVGSTVEISVCYELSLSGECKLSVPEILNTSYNPPFEYSYQCGSSLITYYAPAYVSLCMVSTFLTPGMQCVLAALHRCAVPQSRWRVTVGYLLPHILKVHALDEPAFLLKLPRRVLFDPNSLLIQMITYVGVLLTFGAVFPPLAVALMVAMGMVAIVAKMNISLFLQSCFDRRLSHIVQQVNAECKGVASNTVLYNALWMLISMSCMFYTIFLFDTLGDAVGWNDAYWLFVVIPLMPLVLFAMVHIYSCLYHAECAPHNKSQDNDVELSDRSDARNDQRGNITFSPLALPVHPQHSHE